MFSTPNLIWLCQILTRSCLLRSVHTDDSLTKCDDFEPLPINQVDKLQNFQVEAIQRSEPVEEGKVSNS